MSRGISEAKATEMIIMGFVEPFTKELPMEYAVELNRLIGMEMDGSVGWNRVLILMSIFEEKLAKLLSAIWRLWIDV